MIFLKIKNENCDIIGDFFRIKIEINQNDLQISKEIISNFLNKLKTE
jgi:hypothetical protein